MVPAPEAADSVPQLLLADIPRPPTPPRDKATSQDNIKSAEKGLLNPNKSRSSTILTPDSSAESPKLDTLNTTTRKKVNWPDHNTTASSPVVDPLPASGEFKTIKSILKPYNGSGNSSSLGIATKLSPPHAYPNLAAMLESIAQQLAGDDRNSKLDAYTTLSGTIAASDNFPDVRVLKDKMPTLLQFMKRDMTAKTTTGSWDTSLIVNNLILVSTFLSKPAIADILTADFCVFIVDFATKTFEDPGLSKDVVKRLLFILAKQNFSTKILSPARVGKLITALSNVENLVKGKSIANGRLDVFRNLLRVSRSQMISNTAWVEVMLQAMLSTLKETRSLAINFGIEAALTFGAEVKVTRAVMEVFQRCLDEGAEPSFGDYFAKRMKDMVSKRQEGGSAHVPRIWSVTILFLRSRRHQFEQWSLMNLWLQVMSECFNSSDVHTKIEANLAWNRLIFAVRPDETTSRKLMATLCRPLLEQLRRKVKSTNAARCRKATMSSICFLLYYSLKPDSTAAQLELYWDEYVAQIVGKALTPINITDFPELARRDMMDACHILRSLFDSTTPRQWKETRATDLGIAVAEMKFRELPALDSKWLRKNASRVFPLLNPILERLYWDLNDEAALPITLWKTYITSIASPAVKEVKVSIETMGCVACVFDFLYRMWQTGPDSLRSLPATSGPTGHEFLGSFGGIIIPLIEGLGLLPFTEKLLSMGTQDTFIVIATPSQKPRNSRGEALCPLHHLFTLLVNPCPGLEYDWKFVQLVRQIATPFFEARITSKHQMDLIKDLLHLLPKESTEPSRLIWQVLAEFATTAADTRDGNGVGIGAIVNESLGVEYRNALKILELGIDLAPYDPLPGWKNYFEALVTSSTIDAGDGGRAIAIIEPLARTLSTTFTKGSQPAISYCRMLASKATYPKDRLGLDNARRKLGATSNNNQKLTTTSFDPYKYLYECIRLCLENSYATLIQDRPLDCADLLSAVTALLNRCPSLALANVLLSLQNGIACWIGDENSRLSGGNPLSQAVKYLDPVSCSLLTLSKVTSLWGRVCFHLTSVVKSSTSYTKALNDYETLLHSGLESKHRTIVNSTIRLWNSTFGCCEDELEYTVKVTEALRKLQPIADLSLPFFFQSLEAEGESPDARQVHNFVDTQDDISEDLGSKNLSAILRRTPYLHHARSPQRSFTPHALIGPNRSVSGKRLREETPEMVNRKFKKRVSTPKLRHDNSQVQFEAIESSPIASAMLESQLLTDRQREVKERQQAEAAMFPDIRSSPRPKERSHQRHSSTDLPLHRSASKAMLVSNRSERQTTPNFAPQVDYDAYVNSSPTPTRSPQKDETLHGPSLSPLEAFHTENGQLYAGDDDIPSSPPEMHDQFDHDTTTSIDPSAQIDPLAFDNDRTISTFEYTPLENVNSAVVGSSIAIQVVTTDDHSSPAPTTPIQEDTSIMQQHTPRTPVFHDALERHASSDDISSEDGIFQDSISSPIMPVGAPPKRSSPLSDLDESSMIRLMTEIDAVPDLRRSSTPTKVIVDQTSPKLEPSVAEDLNGTAVSLHQFEANPQPLQKPHHGSASKKSNALAVDIHNKSSSVPSLIPETPGTKINLVKQEFDSEAEQTIVVELPRDFLEIVNRHLIVTPAGPIVPKRASTNIPKKRASPSERTSSYKRISTSESNLPSPSAAKRKRQDSVLDSQELQAQLMAPPKKRGRPRKSASVTPSQSDTSSQLRSSPRFASVELPGPSQNGEETSMQSAHSQQVAQGADNESASMELNIKEQPEVPVSAEVVSDGRNLSQDMPRESEDMQDMTRNEVVAETTAGLNKLSSAASKIDVEMEEPQQSGISAEVDQSIISSTPFKPVVDDVTTETKPIDIPTTQRIREKLESIIGEMSNAAFSREEVSTFEDMLMDVKEKLYGAARRGRAEERSVK